MSWAERVAEQSPQVQRSRTRGVQQARAIVEAARRLIAAKGPAFTTQELIREAHIALQTFYRYFPGKDQLMLAVIEDIIDEATTAYREAARSIEDPVEQLRYYITAAVRGLASEGRGPTFITVEHWRLQTLFPAEVAQATQPFTDVLLEAINAGSETGQVRTADPEYSAWLLTQLTMAVFHHYDSAGLDEPAEAVAERLWAFCLAALGGAPSDRR